MESWKGQTLVDRRDREEALPPEEALAILRQRASAKGGADNLAHDDVGKWPHEVKLVVIDDTANYQECTVTVTARN